MVGPTVTKRLSHRAIQDAAFGEGECRDAWACAALGSAETRNAANPRTVMNALLAAARPEFPPTDQFLRLSTGARHGEAPALAGGKSRSSIAKCGAPPVARPVHPAPRLLGASRSERSRPKEAF